MQDVFSPTTAFFDSQLKNFPMGFLPPYLVGNDYLVEELEQFELLEGPPQTTIPIGENSEAEPLPAQSLQQGTDGGVERPGGGGDEVLVEVRKNRPDLLLRDGLAESVCDDPQPLST